MTKSLESYAFLESFLVDFSVEFLRVSESIDYFLEILDLGRLPVNLRSLRKFGLETFKEFQRVSEGFRGFAVFGDF